jgi:5'(3')-deoxyribonucleotidase
MVFFYDTDPVHKVLLYDEVTINDRSQLAFEISDYIKYEMRYGKTVERVKYPEFVKNIENISKSYEEEHGEEYEEEYYDEYNALDGKVEVENFDEDIDDYDHDKLMQMIMPEIIERLNQYTDDLLGQWNSLKQEISKEVPTLYMDFNVIKCKPDFTTNMLKNSITNSIYYIKK